MAEGIRVDQLARELGIPSADIVARCRANGLGRKVRDDQTLLAGDLLVAVRSWFAAAPENRQSTRTPKRRSPRTRTPKEKREIEIYDVVGVEPKGESPADADVYEIADAMNVPQTIAPLELLMAQTAAVERLVEREIAEAVKEIEMLGETAADVAENETPAQRDAEVIATAADGPAVVAEAEQNVEEPALVGASVETNLAQAEFVMKEDPGAGATVVVETVAAAEIAVPPACAEIAAPAEAVSETKVQTPLPAVEPAVVAAAAETSDVAQAPAAEVVAPLAPATPVVSEARKPMIVEAPVNVEVPAPVVDETKPEPAPVVAEPIQAAVDCAVTNRAANKVWLPKIRLGASLGIYLTDDKMVWTLAEKLPFGTRVAETFEQPITRNEWATGVAKVLEKYLVGRRKKSIRVTIGLPSSHVFFATLPQSTKAETASALLTAHNCCSAIPDTELCCDLVPLKLTGKTYASVGAARRKEIAALMEVATKTGASAMRVEPGPWALLRLGGNRGAGNKIWLRLFVCGTELVAVLAQGTHPLLWRMVELSPSGSEAADSIISLVRTFEAYATQHIGLDEIGSITLQGEQMPERLAERLQAELGAKFSPIEGPGPTPAAMSKGLALGGMHWDKPALDLARALAPPPRLADLVPYGELAVMAAVVVCSGLWLWWAGNEARDRALALEERNAKNAMVKMDDGRLMQEKTMLSAEVQGVSKFLSNRILWTEYVNQLSSRVPEGVTCVQVLGEYELSTGAEKNEKKLKRSLQVDFAAALPKDVSAPPEVDQVLTTLRQSPVIRRDFPEVKLASLRVNKVQKRGGGDGTDPATFTVNCAPKAKSTGGGGAK